MQLRSSKATSPESRSCSVNLRHGLRHQQNSKGRIHDGGPEVAHEATHEAAHSERKEAKRIGLLISILALFLAASEMLGKSAQTEVLALNIEASNTWNFFQAKTVRQTAVRTALENARLNQPPDTPEAQKQLRDWQANVERWESEPSTNEGRRELMAKATRVEKARDEALIKYHAYETASLVIQLGIVLASVALLSSVMMFAFGAAGVGTLGLLLVAGTHLNWTPVLNAFHH